MRLDGCEVKRERVLESGEQELGDLGVEGWWWSSWLPAQLTPGDGDQCGSSCGPESPAPERVWKRCVVEFLFSLWL